MTAAPTDIPLDDRGAPDLQLLVRKLGEAAAKERGEAYDPAHNPAHAGYPRITPAIWQASDEAMAAYQSAHRAGLALPPVIAIATASNMTDATPPPSPRRSRACFIAVPLRSHVIAPRHRPRATRDSQRAALLRWHRDGFFDALDISPK